MPSLNISYLSKVGMLAIFRTRLRLLKLIEEEVISTYQLAMNRGRTEILSVFLFARRVVGHWKRLSRDIVSVDTLESFKTRLDKHFIVKDLAYKYSWDIITSARALTVLCT